MAHFFPTTTAATARREDWLQDVFLPESEVWQGMPRTYWGGTPFSCSVRTDRARDRCLRRWLTSILTLSLGRRVRSPSSSFARV